MKNYNFLRFWPLALATVLIVGCTKDEKKSKVDENGLTKEITDLIPDSILTVMKTMGVPIYGGETPPNIEGSFFASPLLLERSNVPSDVVGMHFADLSITFSDQDNEALAVKVDYVNGPETGQGLGSFIVGEGNKFTVFTKIDVMANGYPAKAVYIYSGELNECGIDNFYLSNFMIDNFGNPGYVYIENGQGRVVYDGDKSTEASDLHPKYDYEVPNGVPLVPQPNDVTCWAASMTMMMMWRDNSSYSISTAMGIIGNVWRNKFLAPQGLTDSEWNQFTATAGMKSILFSPTVKGLNDLLQNGPLLVAIDEDPGPKYSPHAKIITGIHGNGGSGCTYLDVNDPWPPNGGKQYTESYESFMSKVEQLLGGTNAVPILHW